MIGNGSTAHLMNYSDVGVSVDNLGNLCNQIGFLSVIYDSKINSNLSLGLTKINKHGKYCTGTAH